MLNVNNSIVLQFGSGEVEESDTQPWLLVKQWPVILYIMFTVVDEAGSEQHKETLMNTG